jgi:two-component system sensor histidine kinase RpfC
LEIHREMLEQRNRKLHHQKDLLTQKNLILRNWDSARKDYYHKVSLALQSPVNALDGLTFLLANVAQENNQDYISALRASVRHLQDIVSEFALFNAIDGEKELAEVRSFELREVLENVRENLLKSSVAESPPLLIQLQAEVPDALYGNPAHLLQILHQLLLNVQKNNLNSQLYLKVTPEFPEQETCCLKFQIVETPARSSPISPAPVSNNSEESATDLILRLSLVKKLIELEGGWIHVERSENSFGCIIEARLCYSLAE